MKPITTLLACLLITTAFAGCLFGDDPVSGCTDSDAINYDSSADDDDGTCVMPATQGELESAALAQLTAFETSKANGDAYGIRTVSTTNVQTDDGNTETEIVAIEISDVENNAMRYTYWMEINGMEMIDYDVRQKGSIINAQSEGDWYLVKDEQPNAAELLAAIANEAEEGDSESDAEYTCDNGATVPISWVNDGTDDCFDGTDEGVDQEEIDAAIAEDAAENSGIIKLQEFDEMDWEMVVAYGYQSLVADEDDGTISLNFDGDLQLVSITVKAKDTEELGMDFENNVATMTFLDGSQLDFDVSDSHPPAASPFVLETDYNLDFYTWDCKFVIQITPEMNLTDDTLSGMFEDANELETEMPDWCDDVYHSHEMANWIDTDNPGDVSHWTDGLYVGNYYGELWYVDNNTVVKKNLDEPGAVFVCNNGQEVQGDWVNDGMDDCSDGSDEGISEQDAQDNTFYQCDYSSSHEYSESTESCDRFWPISDVEMDETYLRIIAEDQDSYDFYDGEVMFKHQSAFAETGDENLSFLGIRTNTYDHEGLQPYAFIIDDSMNFQNDLDEFRLDLGYEKMNDDGETEFTKRISFDLSLMQSGSDTGVGGYEWAFKYTDANGNGYLDHGDSFVIYTNAEGEDSWDSPTVKLYHVWGQGYTDESPVLLPGFTVLSTICLLGIAALNRRKD